MKIERTVHELKYSRMTQSLVATFLMDLITRVNLHDPVNRIFPCFASYSIQSKIISAQK